MFEVVLGQGRLLALKEALTDVPVPAEKGTAPSVALGNPDIADFDILDPRHIRVIGKKIGVTDLVLTARNGRIYSFEIHVVYELNLVQARVRELFPEARVRVAQIGKNLVVEGQARDSAQIRQIVQLVQRAVLVEEVGGAAQPLLGGAPAPAAGAAPPAGGMGPMGGAPDQTTPEAQTGPEIINLLRVPGPQQVMLKVQIAELNRTALRQIGNDFLFVQDNTILGSKLTSITTGTSTAGAGGLVGSATTAALSASPTTAFGIFQGIGFQMMLSALRQNSLLRILAEPNLVAMNGHMANFLAGGEFPVPVPQSGAGGGPATITVQYKRFGVMLSFIPYIMDGETIRLSVDPEVSTIDFALGIELSGTRVPGLNTRNAHTVVELREGQTLAIAGLLELTLSNQISRIPLLGDLPYIGPFFSNNTANTIDKELVVLVTPFLVEALPPGEVPPRPGDEVYEPNDLEFYLLGRIQGRTGHREFRSTTNVDDPLNLMRRLRLESRELQGPHGFSD